ncbi:hypothetical protein [Telmatospirillum sp.]|uniref:hypothetical protein n=1 Tax=Telmatospirillum sp. TaxID=2079197 RepID=UPI002851C446|nr:hypothetical protein [Telmatospirillum sp.]MDR3441319.1 hypothetical protein [Telmatospirillum sp.]
MPHSLPSHVPPEPLDLRVSDASRASKARLLFERLQHSLDANTRNGRDEALLFIDLDDFEAFN